jgi:hypothetical protein
MALLLKLMSHGTQRRILRERQVSHLRTLHLFHGMARRRARTPAPKIARRSDHLVVLLLPIGIPKL